jgi:tRNA/rRNA methyltransferase
MKKQNIYFILYKPAVPGNIGASARAIKTMGFKNLRLIDPADQTSDEAMMMAHGSTDILKNCEVFSSFEETIVDLDFIISTTAKKKSAKVDYISSQNLAALINDKKEIVQNIGIVFGSEESGLPNSILQKSNIGVTIPMNEPYPSLNLSQAVMIIAYELQKSSQLFTSDQTDAQSSASWSQLQERTEKILLQTGIQPGSPLFHRIIERLSFLKASDARLVHTISNKLQDYLTEDNKEGGGD